MSKKTINSNIYKFCTKPFISIAEKYIKPNKRKIVPNIIRNNIYSDDFHHIYLYDSISNSSVLAVTLQINSFNEPGFQKKPIVIHINSPGGDLHSGIALLTILQSSKTVIVTIIEGICASAATYIAVAADYRLISPYATMMIHQYSGSVTGKFEDIEFQSYTGQKTMDTLYNIYSTYSNLPDYRIREILKNDLFLTPDDCFKYGMVDIVFKETPLVVYDNYFKRNKEYSRFKNIISDKDLFNDIYLYGEQSPADFYEVAIETVKQIQEVLKGKVKEQDVSSVLNGLNYPEEQKEKSLTPITPITSSNLSISDTKINKNKNKTDIKRILPTGDPRPIVLYISDSSMFNTLEDILPIINTILISRIPIFSVINGPSTETTAIYSILCTKRYIHKYGSITIDLAWLWREVPKYSDIIKNTEVYRKIVLDIFTKHTSLPKEILDTLFTSKHYFDAKKCLEYKLCDAII